MIKLEKYDYETKECKVVAEVQARTIAAAIRKPEVFAEVLEALCNSFSTGRSHGQAVGQALCSSHCTLQRIVVGEMIGILEGLAEQEHTDARNQQAIEVCRKIASAPPVLGPKL